MQVGKKYWANIVTKVKKGSGYSKGDILDYSVKKTALDTAALLDGVLEVKGKRIQIVDLSAE